MTGPAALLDVVQRKVDTWPAGLMARLKLEPGLDYVVALLALLLAVAAYVDAWSRLPQVGVALGFQPWGDAGVIAAWFALTAALVGTAVAQLSRGRKWGSALPRGYLAALVACGVLGVGTILDGYYQLAFGPGAGLEVLLRPTHLIEFGAGAVIVAAPLQAALRRGDRRAGLPVLVSASLVVATIAFATQFLSPLVDLWPAGGANAPAAPSGWWSEHLGAGSIVLEASLLSGSVLLVIRSFEVRPGSLTLVCAIQGALLAILKMHWWLLPAPLAAGVIADIGVVLLKPSRSRPRQVWILGALCAATFTITYLALLRLAGSFVWDWQLSVGVVLLAGAAGWLLATVLFAVLPSNREFQEGTGIRTSRTATAPAVKSAMEAMHDLRTLSTSPLMGLSVVREEGLSGAGELKAALIAAINDVAASTKFVDAQSGRILADYYVKGIGTHEMLAERHHVSRATYFHRLDRGFDRVADRLDEIDEGVAATEVVSSEAVRSGS